MNSDSQWESLFLWYKFSEGLLFSGRGEAERKGDEREEENRDSGRAW